MTATATLSPAEITAAADAKRAEAAAHLAAERESFERCDTDGFVSQWASGLGAQKALAEAALIEDGGLIETTALFFADGTLASTHLHFGQWGPSWVLNDTAAQRFGKRFVSLSKASTAAKRYAADLKKGFTTGLIKVRGEVTYAGGGRGTGGMCSVYVATRPVLDDLLAGEFEIVTTDRGPVADRFEEDED